MFQPEKLQHFKIFHGTLKRTSEHRKEIVTAIIRQQLVYRLENAYIEF